MSVDYASLGSPVGPGTSKPGYRSIELRSIAWLLGISALWLG